MSGPNSIRTFLLWTEPGPGHILVFHCLWGVYQMGSSSMRLVCSAAVRAVLVPASVALAWLIWGAAAAEARALDAGPAAVAGTPQAAGAPSAASDLTTSRATKPLLAARVVPSIPDLTAPATTTVSTVAGTAAGTADSVAGTADATLDTVTGTAEAVIGEADAAVTTVTTTAAPALAEVDKVIDVVEGAVHSVPRVISVPGVPLPTVPTPEPGVTVPGAHPTSPWATPQSGAADRAHAAPAPGAGNKSEGTSLARATAGQPLDAAGASLAQLQMTTPHRPETAGAVPAAPVGLPHATPHQEPLASLAEGPSGSSSSGSAGSGVQAADVAGSWSGMHLGAGARTHDANQAVPASPAFDPGSSPD